MSNCPADPSDPIPLSDLKQDVRTREARMTERDRRMYPTRKAVIGWLVDDIRGNRREAAERWSA